MKDFKINEIVFISIAIILCFCPFFSPALALGLGVLYSFLPFSTSKLSKYTSRVLQFSVVLMGFGVNLYEAIATSKISFELTAISVVSVIAFGLLFGKILGVEKKLSILIAAGTAICGGSAIAAVAPVLRAKDSQISFSLVVIFLLNGIALFVFPILGHYFNLSQETFGYWAAIAIHDTSSVVGAGETYGAQALQIATTVKLTRALWIIPLSLALAVFFKDDTKTKIKFPWFILLFVCSMVIAQYFSNYSAIFHSLSFLGKKSMYFALFLVGTSVSFNELKKVGSRSIMLGVILWIFISVLSFVLLTHINI